MGARTARPARWTAAVVIGLALVAAACSSSEPAPSAGSAPVGTAPLGTAADETVVRGGELIVGLAAETNDWNPAAGQWATSGGIVARAVYDPLAVVDGDGSVQPYLAESFEPDADFTEWTITVRDGVTFHDGTPLDADALVANLEARRTGPLTASAYVAIEAVEPAGPRSVRVAMNRPWSTFPLAMAGQGGYVAAPATLEDAEGGTRPIGTGPFAFVSWESGSELVVERNPSYWQVADDGQPLPLLDAVRFRVVTDPASRVQSQAAGDLDVVEVDDVVQVAALEEAAAAGELQLWVDRATSSGFVALNTAAPPFDDPVARQAVAAAIDTARIADELALGLVPPADGPLEPGSLGALTPEESGYPTHDPARARELAAEYEQAAGTPLTFSYTTLGDPASLALATLLQSMLADAGIVMEVEVLEQTAAIAGVLTGRYQASYYASRSLPTLDASYSLFAGAPQPVGALSLNVTRIDSPELRAAMDAARATDDPDAQAAAYGDAQRLIATELGWLYVVRDVAGLAAANEVRGIEDAVVPGTDVDATRFDTLPFLTATWLDGDR